MTELAWVVGRPEIENTWHRAQVCHRLAASALSLLQASDPQVLTGEAGPGRGLSALKLVEPQLLCDSGLGTEPLCSCLYSCRVSNNNPIFRALPPGMG